MSTSVGRTKPTQRDSFLSRAVGLKRIFAEDSDVVHDDSAPPSNEHHLDLSGFVMRVNAKLNQKQKLNLKMKLKRERNRNRNKMLKAASQLDTTLRACLEPIVAWVLNRTNTPLAGVG